MGVCTSCSTPIEEEEGECADCGGENTSVGDESEESMDTDEKEME